MTFEEPSRDREYKANAEIAKPRAITDLHILRANCTKDWKYKVFDLTSKTNHMVDVTVPLPIFSLFASKENEV